MEPLESLTITQRLSSCTYIYIWPSDLSHKSQRRGFSRNSLFFFLASLVRLFGVAIPVGRAFPLPEKYPTIPASKAFPSPERYPTIPASKAFPLPERYPTIPASLAFPLPERYCIGSCVSYAMYWSNVVWHARLP